MMLLPGDAVFFQKLYALDEEICRELKLKGCRHCGSPLDVANIPRKLRGRQEGPTIRFGLCCRKQGCRKRVLPPSLRFLGRKVYGALTVILAADFYNRLMLREAIPRRTLTRWRSFWKSELSESSSFMRWARARGILPIAQAGESPRNILMAFGFPGVESLIPALRFFTQFRHGPE